jgi:hypothetical protein
MIAGRIATLPVGRPDDKQTKSSNSIADTAALLNVGTSVVKDARAVLASGGSSGLQGPVTAKLCNLATPQKPIFRGF